MIYADANPAQAKTYENLLRQRRILKESKWKNLNCYLNLSYVVIVLKDKNFDDMF